MRQEGSSIHQAQDGEHTWVAINIFKSKKTNNGSNNDTYQKVIHNKSGPMNIDID